MCSPARTAPAGPQPCPPPPRPLRVGRPAPIRQGPASRHTTAIAIQPSPTDQRSRFDAKLTGYLLSPGRQSSRPSSLLVRCYSSAGSPCSTSAVRGTVPPPKSLPRTTWLGSAGLTGRAAAPPMKSVPTLRISQPSPPPRRRRLIERLDLCTNQREGKRFGIAGRLPPVLRTGDRQNTRLLDEPPQRHLRRSLGIASTDLTQQGHHRLHLLQTIPSEGTVEAPNPLGPVPRSILPGEHAHRQRRLHGAIDHIPPAEHEALYYREHTQSKEVA
jgi:hypothetical protein